MASRFNKVLVANRGEIAIRIFRAAKSLGYRCVAVFSDPDANALHVEMADEAVALGGSTALSSYLAIDKVIAAAKKVGAQAIHPGYGFLAENAVFARACTEHGLIFVGPSASAMEHLGDKIQAKQLASRVGLLCVPGYYGQDQNNERLLAEAKAIGFPLLIKAARGGGGKGMRLVPRLEDFSQALSTAKSEAHKAFGNNTVMLEKAILGPRHVEVQILGDHFGQRVHLGARDCSTQRRHQKLIEEAPPMHLPDELREAMGQAALTLAHAVEYESAGTVEFLLDDTGQFYFLEVNTRLQVEHRVTEAVTGIDLVAWQLRIANHERLSLTQADVIDRGHAIEARLCAEDSYADFVPQSGVIWQWRPAQGAGLQCDHGFHERGDVVSSYYDSMVAKVIAVGDTREQARQRLVRGLEDTVILGLTTNQTFLRDVLNTSEFITGAVRTDFLHNLAVTHALWLRPQPGVDIQALAAVLLYRAGEKNNPEPALRNFSNSEYPSTNMVLRWEDKAVVAQVRPTTPATYYVDLEGTHVVTLHNDNDSEGKIIFTCDGIENRAHYGVGANTAALAVTVNGVHFLWREETSTKNPRDSATNQDGRMVAPLSGRVVRVRCKEGDSVVRGDVLAVIESMKMEHEIKAKIAGFVVKTLIKEGATIQAGATMVEIQAEEKRERE